VGWGPALLCRCVTCTLLVQVREEVSYLLEAVETALLRSPIFIGVVVSQLRERQQHAQLVERFLVAVRLHLLHDELKILFVGGRPREDFQVNLALDVKNSAFKVELAFAGDRLQQNLDLLPVAFED